MIDIKTIKNRNWAAIKNIDNQLHFVFSQRLQQWYKWCASISKNHYLCIIFLLIELYKSGINRIEIKMIFIIGGSIHKVYYSVLSLH